MRFGIFSCGSLSHPRRLREVGISLALALALCGTALAQQISVSGRITSVQGDPIEGVAVLVQGTDIRANTDADGRYSLTAPTDGVLVLSSLGYRAAAVSIRGRGAIDIVLEPSIAALDETIVTGYTEQRRSDITGAVSSVAMPSVSRQNTASVLKRLAARVPGVTVEASGSHASRSTVRIRGVSSFQNNDPLYVIDGTPIEDSYLNWLNPWDIESIQVLKDASAASIYGSRASNGVIVIETARGTAGPPRFSLDVRTGVAKPVRGYDDFLILDALEYQEVVRQSYENAGWGYLPENIYGDPNHPTIPAYIWPNDGVNQTQPGDVDESAYVWGDPSNQDGMIMRGSPGTNWWDAVFGTGLSTDANLAVSGGGTDHRYTASFNYLNQEGTAAYNRFQRGSVRLNTEFNVGIFTVGENVSLSLQESYGGMDDPGSNAERGIMGMNILMQPVVPVYDIEGQRREAAGLDPAPYFAAGKAVGLGNQWNPLKEAWADKDDKYKNTVLFGNVFAHADVTDGLRLTSRFGFYLSEFSGVDFRPMSPENSEPWFTDALAESWHTLRDWTWTNTMLYTNTYGGRHNVSLLLGQEVNQNKTRFLAAAIGDLVTTDIDARYIQDALGDPETKNVASSGGKVSSLSVFGRIDYNFADRYLLSFTLRRDASSAFGPANRWGTFPAFGVGWRLSEEPFLQGSQLFTNIMLRFGWGITGNRYIPTGRVFTQFGGGTGDSYYDIGGTGNTIVVGYRQTVLGNPNLKWEENESKNLGLDLEFLGGKASLVVDVYQRDSDGLFFNPQLPGAVGMAAPPVVNIGQVRNRGIDFSIGYTGSIGGASWSIALNASHYKNEIVRIDGVTEFFYGPISTRFGNQVINQVGHPIGSFYGLVADGFFESQDVANDYLPWIYPEGCRATCQDGAAPGRIRFVDQLTEDTDNDGVPDQADGYINWDDRTIVGSPHPDLTAGLDIEVLTGPWDFSANLFGTFGNEIWDAQKEFYVFGLLAANVRRDLLTDSWTPRNLDAKYPRLDRNDTFSGQQLSSFYVEDGSYVRLRSLQIGYRMPRSWMPGMRVYLQAENLFTITGYPGLDPALPAADIFGVTGDVRDQYRGVDRGAYPSNKTFSVGISAEF
jgi:TonB-linked SusC/RagA family outer membrane protein